MNVTREDLRVVREKKNENLIPFVSTFNPKNPEMFNTIRQNLPILHEDEKNESNNAKLSNHKK